MNVPRSTQLRPFILPGDCPLSLKFYCRLIPQYISLFFPYPSPSECNISQILPLIYMLIYNFLIFHFNCAANISLLFVGNFCCSGAKGGELIHKNRMFLLTQQFLFSSSGHMASTHTSLTQKLFFSFQIYRN
jgi:hypothetical protein